jgi:hypothetical protein
MDAYWDTVIAPALAAVRPRTIVEIGAEHGHTTRRLLDYCAAHDAALHSIDPRPHFDVAAWEAEADGRLTVHQARSLDALPTLHGYDAVLIDGDHNWYTVLSELRLIEAACVPNSAPNSAPDPRPFPLVLLHDVGWPYGRRDLYYDPESIPAQHRQPFGRLGILPGTANLVPGGFNHGFCNARAAHTPQNGVLTAVEDFIRESPQTLALVQIPGLHGLGLLFDPALASRHPDFAAQLRLWNLPKAVRRHIMTIELARIRLLVTAERLRAAAGAREAGGS